MSLKIVTVATDVEEDEFIFTVEFDDENQFCTLRIRQPKSSINESVRLSTRERISLARALHDRDL